MSHSRHPKSASAGAIVVILACLAATAGAQNGNLALQVLALESGGRVFNTGNDVAGEIAVCAGDANAYYEVVYDIAPGDGPAEYHALEIKLGKRGLTPHTLTGIYGVE